MNNRMIDRALDVDNILKDLPLDDTNTALYIQSELDIDESMEEFSCESTVIMHGGQRSLSLSLYSEMCENDEFKQMIMIAAAIYVSSNKEELPLFLSAVNGINPYNEG